MKLNIYRSKNLNYEIKGGLYLNKILSNKLYIKKK